MTGSRREPSTQWSSALRQGRIAPSSPTAGRSPAGSKLFPSDPQEEEPQPAVETTGRLAGVHRRAILERLEAPPGIAIEIHTPSVWKAVWGITAVSPSS